MARLAPDEKVIKVPIGLPEELYEWLRTAAFDQRVPMAEVVRQALREHRHRIEDQLTLPVEGLK